MAQKGKRKIAAPKKSAKKKHSGKAAPAQEFVSLQEIVAKARRKLPRHLWNHLSGGADSETTLLRNRQALDSLALRQRVLVDVRNIDISTTLLGRRLASPVFLAPVGGWLADRFGSRMLCTIGSALTAVSMLGFSRLGADSSQVAVMAPLMLLGLGWAFFQSPNLSGMFSAVEPRHVGAVSGLSLTSANVANAMGVAVGSVLFIRWLKFYGLTDAGVPPYTEWGQAPEIFIRSFQNSWLVIALLAACAIVTSVMRGKDRRSKGTDW